MFTFPISHRPLSYIALPLLDGGASPSVTRKLSIRPKSETTSSATNSFHSLFRMICLFGRATFRATGQRLGLRWKSVATRGAAATGNPWSYLFLMRSTADGQHLSRLFSFNLGPVQFMGHDLYSETKTVTDRNLLRQIPDQNTLATYSIKVRAVVS